MGWETVNYLEKAACACHQGEVLKYGYGKRNDEYYFVKDHDRTEIECPSCARKYNVQLFKRRNFLLTPENCEPYIEQYFLVPKDLEIPNVIYKQPDFEFYHSFEEFVVLYYTKSEIKDIVNSIQIAKVYRSAPQSSHARVIIGTYHDYYHTTDYNQIIESLRKILDNYDSFKWNVSKFENFREEESEMINLNEQEIKKVIDKSYELRFAYAGEQ